MTPHPTLRITRTEPEGIGSVIYLHTLGDTLIKVGEKDIRPASPMLFAALLYLGMERGRRVPRAALQELLFPNVDERSGAHSLRQLLYKLRQLGAPIEVDSSTVIVSVERVRDDAAMDLNEPENVRRLAYGFLPDYEPDLSERFSEWLERQRSATSAEIRKRLVAAIQASRESLNWPAVERLAQALLVFDPYNEVATLGSAESAALTGGKAAAIRMLSTYEQETGSSDLRLPAALLRRRISESIPEPVTRITPMPFMGRDAEVRELRKHITNARAGKPAMYVIGGEAGIGKTRLLEETTALAALEGTKVHIVRCQSHYSSRPLGVFIELVPALRASRGALGVSPQSIACLNLLTSHSDDRTDQPSDARDDVTRSELLLAAVRDLVDAVASEQPLIIGVEDAHWADTNSLRELNRMVQGAPNRSLMVICTTRIPDVFPMFAGIDDRTTVRRLKPLAAAPMGEIAMRLLPHNPDARRQENVEWCVTTAGGNPLFLQMLCTHYVKTGEPFTVPPDITSAIARRIEQLPLNSQRLLQFSALLGRHSSIEILKGLCECSQLQFLDAIHRLDDEGYLHADGDRVRVAHHLLSEGALAMLPPLARRVLHGCVASALQRQYDLTNDASVLWDCAEQWSLSAESEKAVLFLRRCASHACSIGRATDALKLLEKARELAKQGPALVDILGEIMLAARMAFRWDVADQAAQHFDFLQASQPEATKHTEYELASIDTAWHARLDANEAAQRALHCVRAKDTANDHRVDAARILLTMAHERCEKELADIAFTEVAPFLTKESMNFSHRIFPMYFHAVFGDPATAHALAKALEDDLEYFHMPTRMRAAHNAAGMCALMGAYDKTVSIGAEYSERAETLGAKAWAHDFYSVTAAGYIMQESFESAQEWHARATLTAPEQARGALSWVYLANQSELAIWKGNAHEAQSALSHATGVRTDALRLNGYLGGIRLRLAQLDPSFICPDNVHVELMALYDATKRYCCCDGLTAALGEALKRRQRYGRLLSLLSDYAANRRECSAWPPSLSSLASSAGFSVMPQAGFHP